MKNFWLLFLTSGLFLVGCGRQEVSQKETAVSQTESTTPSQTEQSNKTDEDAKTLERQKELADLRVRLQELIKPDSSTPDPTWVAEVKPSNDADLTNLTQLYQRYNDLQDFVDIKLKYSHGITAEEVGSSPADLEKMLRERALFLSDAAFSKRLEYPTNYTSIGEHESVFNILERALEAMKRTGVAPKDIKTTTAEIRKRLLRAAQAEMEGPDGLRIRLRDGSGDAIGVVCNTYVKEYGFTPANLGFTEAGVNKAYKQPEEDTGH